MEIDINKHKAEYNESSFINKIGRFAGILSSGFLIKAVTLWFTLRDKDTPTWAKTIILGALGYFIVPFDAIPDILPIIGFSDDLTALVSATTMIWAHIKPEHSQKAQDKIKKLFKK
jgi:uncharacterized membrane protein YkvA (DUF1232 family)